MSAYMSVSRLEDEAGGTVSTAIDQKSQEAPVPFVDLHSSAPYADALADHAGQASIHLMVPGHGCEPNRMTAGISNLIGEDVLGIDLPLLVDGVDLGDNSALQRAQELAASAWGSKRCWFMTSGSSQANRVAAIAAKSLGDVVLVQRNAHSSFIDGMLMSGLAPQYLSPSIDLQHGIAHGITAEQVELKLRQMRRDQVTVGALYIVSPSYFGTVSDVAAISEVAHRFGVALIVDGAWGPHFGFHESLPECPLSLGADLFITSTHKLAGSLTQSALLHLGVGSFAQRLEPLVERALTVTATTSPSAILMASLDLARRELVLGTEHIGRTIEQAQALRTLIEASPFYELIDSGATPFTDVIGFDALHLVIDVTKTHRTGHWIRERLISDHRVYFEMSTASVIVAIIGVGRDLDIAAIIGALEDVAAIPVEFEDLGAAFPGIPAPGTTRMSPQEAFFAKHEVVAARDGVGRISADSVAAYPPGVPNLLPGEEITAETLDFLVAVAAAPGGYVRGSFDDSMTALRVVVQE